MSYYDDKTVDYIRKNSLSMDDTFDFHCSGCKKCCKDKDTLLITGLDIFRIAQELKITTEEVITRYCFMYLGSDSRLPLVSIRMRPYDKTCMFLKQGKCSLEKNLPLSCAIYPLGRMLDITAEYTYFNQNTGCGFKGKEKQTLKEYLDKWGINKLDAASKAWGKAIVDLAAFCITIKDAKRLELTQRAIIGALYSYYDINKDYIEQLERNLENLKKIMPGFGVKH